MDTDALIASLAAELGIAPPTVRKWRQRGLVPHGRRFDLSQAAATRGFILRREAFDNFGRRAEQRAA